MPPITGGRGSVVIMAHAGEDHQAVIGDSVGEAILVIDAAAPHAALVTLQRLGLAGAAEGVARRVPDKVVDLLEGFPVVFLPEKISVPRGLILKRYLRHRRSPLFSAVQAAEVWGRPALPAPAPPIPPWSLQSDAPLPRGQRAGEALPR